MILIPHLIYPGTWPLVEGETAGDLLGMFCHIEIALADATVNLAWFREAYERPLPTIEQRRADRDQLSAQSRAADDLVRQELGAHDPWDMRDRVIVEVGKRLLAAAAEKGIWPSTFEARLQHIHAQGFVLALDQVEKSLMLFSKTWPSLKTPAEAALATFRAGIPGLSSVRNSLAHAEDRSIRKTRNKTIKPEPINTPNISTVGNVMVVGSLEDDCVSCTLADGSHALLPCRVETLTNALVPVQGLIDAVEWKGRARVWPYP